MAGLANQLPPSGLGASGHFANYVGDIRNVVQHSEASDQVERVVGERHLPAFIRLYVFEAGNLEIPSWFENGYSLGATQDGPQFISIGAADAEDVLK
jgi:hypothetical protein